MVVRAAVVAAVVAAAAAAAAAVVEMGRGRESRRARGWRLVLSSFR